MKTSPFVLCFIFCLSACNNSLDKLAEATEINTSEIINIGSNSASSGGFDILNNSSEIFQRGVCWDTLPNPEVTEVVHLHSFNGVGSDDFTSEMEWLQDETEYYVRAYAINDEGIFYGNELKFTTEKVILNIECTPAINSLSINSTNFNSVETGWGVPVLGEYGLEGHSASFDFSIGFERPPRSGVYTNVGFNIPEEFLWKRECSMSLTNIGIPPGGTIYVERIAKDNYSITFCDLELSAGPSNFTAAGNLTSE